MHEHETILEWTAAGGLEHTRGKLWYTAVGSAFLALVIYSIVTHAWTFTLVLAMCGGLYAYTHRHFSGMLTMKVARDGFELDGKKTYWGECSGFWMLQGKGYVELHIERQQGVDRHVLVHTGSMDPYVIRDVLTEFLPHLADRKETVVDAFIRICKL